MTLVRLIELASIVLAGVALVVIAIGAYQISQARRREREAVDAAARSMRLSTDLLGMVGHDLRGPLTSLVGLSESVRERWRDLPPNEVENELRLVADQGRRLCRLVDDLLVIPGAEAGRLRLEPNWVDLAPIARSATTATFGTDARVVAVLLPEDAKVWADPRRLEQVLRNLLQNARVHGEGRVTVEGSTRDAEYLVAVSDQGPGVDEGDEERIFEPFEHRTDGDPAGMGLGLSIARTLARAMGGDVWCEPGRPIGARFLASFPLHENGAPRIGNGDGMTSSEQIAPV